MTSVVELQALYTAWSAADKAWMAEIVAAYPKQWPGDVRYTVTGRGNPDTSLRRAYDAYLAAINAFEAAGGSAWLQGQSVDRTATDADIQDRLRDEIANTGDC